MASPESITINDEPVATGSFSAAHATHVGRVRTENQDAAWASAEAGRALLVVADGMGGYQGGAAASTTATQLVRERLEQTAPDSAPDMESAFSAVADVVAEAAPDGGTTLVVAVITPELVDVWHVGDSRAYLLRDDALIRVTSDHSWVQGLVDSGQLTSEQAARHPRRNVLLRAIGKGRESNPSHSAMRFMAGDVLLLCSDGLHGVVPDPEIAAIMKTRSDLADMAQALIDAALDLGAPDNIGVALGSWTVSE